MKKETSNIIVFPKNLFPLNVISKYDFGVVLSDPPWMNMGGEKHYPTMSLDAIKSMPIKALTKENAACFLWITNALLQEGLDVLKAWGFTYRCSFYWVKSQMGLGQYMRNASETLLMGTKGKMPVAFKSQANWAFMPRQEHSHKPEEMYAIIERLYPNCDYLELFARKRPSNPDWYIWGNEAEGGSDIFVPGYPVPEYSDRVQFLPDDPDNDPTSDAIKEVA